METLFMYCGEFTAMILQSINEKFRSYLVRQLESETLLKVILSQLIDKPLLAFPFSSVSQVHN